MEVETFKVFQWSLPAITLMNSLSSKIDCLLFENNIYLFRSLAGKVGRTKQESLEESAKLKENTDSFRTTYIIWQNKDVWYSNITNQKTWSTIWTTPLVASMSKSLTVASPADDFMVTYFMLYLEWIKIVLHKTSVLHPFGRQKFESSVSDDFDKSLTIEPLTLQFLRLPLWPLGSLHLAHPM